MDSSTTLMAFMLQTSTSIETVSLIGSWDNFTARYPMKRDTRRARGQWRGTFAFKDIICDGSEQNGSRDGGLKMGQEYWFYYELDNSIESYNHTLPSTTSCPFLPGQLVNVLEVPMERPSPRSRSGSLSGISNYQLQTLRPEDKYITPRELDESIQPTRLDTAPPLFMESLTPPQSARSSSPKKRTWSPRRLLGLRTTEHATPSSPPNESTSVLDLRRPKSRNPASNEVSSTPDFQPLRSKSKHDRLAASGKMAHTRSTTLPFRSSHHVHYNGSSKSGVLEDTTPAYHSSSPKRQTIHVAPNTLHSDQLSNSDEYDEDDLNFASSTLFSQSPTAILGGLNPPTSRTRPRSSYRSPIRPRSPLSLANKPLPQPPSPIDPKCDRRRGYIISPLKFVFPRSPSILPSPETSPIASPISTPSSDSDTSLYSAASDTYRLPFEEQHVLSDSVSAKRVSIRGHDMRDTFGVEDEWPSQLVDDLRYLGDVIDSRVDI